MPIFNDYRQFSKAVYNYVSHSILPNLLLGIWIVLGLTTLIANPVYTYLLLSLSSFFSYSNQGVQLNSSNVLKKAFLISSYLCFFFLLYLNSVPMIFIAYGVVFYVSLISCLNIFFYNLPVPDLKIIEHYNWSIVKIDLTAYTFATNHNFIIYYSNLKATILEITHYLQFGHLQILPAFLLLFGSYTLYQKMHEKGINEDQSIPYLTLQATIMFITLICINTNFALIITKPYLVLPYLACILITQSYPKKAIPSRFKQFVDAFPYFALVGILSYFFSSLSAPTIVTSLLLLNVLNFVSKRYFPNENREGVLEPYCRKVSEITSHIEEFSPINAFLANLALRIDNLYTSIHSNYEHTYRLSSYNYLPSSLPLHVQAIEICFFFCILRDIDLIPSSLGAIGLQQLNALTKLTFKNNQNPIGKLSLSRRIILMHDPNNDPAIAHYNVFQLLEYNPNKPIYGGIETITPEVAVRAIDYYLKTFPFESTSIDKLISQRVVTIHFRHAALLTFQLLHYSYGEVIYKPEHKDIVGRTIQASRDQIKTLRTVIKSAVMRCSTIYHASQIAKAKKAMLTVALCINKLKNTRPTVWNQPSSYFTAVRYIAFHYIGMNIFFNRIVRVNDRIKIAYDPTFIPLYLINPLLFIHSESKNLHYNDKTRSMGAIHAVLSDKNITPDEYRETIDTKAYLYETIAKAHLATPIIYSYQKQDTGNAIMSKTS